MNITRLAVAIVAIAIGVAVHALLVPVVIGVSLYLLVRVVDARLNRW
jgi:hypothetical protein